MSAREEVLGRVRAALAGARRTPSGASSVSAADPAPGVPRALREGERHACFRAMLERAGARCRPARGEGEAGRVLAEVLAELGAREVALSDAPLVARLARALPPELHTFDGSRDRERLFACDAGVSAAQWGIAETGSLVLESSAERHRLVSLVPRAHVALLRASELLSTLGEALERIGARPGGPATTVTIVTGPSRTADIELALVVGVHGPEHLTVILLEDSE